MEALKDKLVTQVACGAWHTAAVASPRPQGPDVLEGLPFIERLAVQHKLAAMYELTEEVGRCPASALVSMRAGLGCQKVCNPQVVIAAERMTSIKQKSRKSRA